MKYKYFVFFSLLLLFCTAAFAKKGGKKGHHGDACETGNYAYGYAAYQHGGVPSYYGRPAGLPPGLAKKDRLPPGIEKHLLERGSLTPGLQKKILAPQEWRYGWRAYRPTNPGVVVVVSF